MKAFSLTLSSSFVLIDSQRDFQGEPMPDLDFIRADIEFMRVQVGRLRKEMLLLQRAGISTASAEDLLQRMLTKIEGLCAERDRLKEELPKPEAKVLGGRKW